MIKSQISRKLVTNGISTVVIASVHSEKACLKKMIMIISMNKLQETMVFDGHQNQKLISAMKQDRKVMVDFKFDALYRYVFIESLLKSG